ncbi:Serine aminopeptidase, S33 [Pustulibacterium marinum]|uniref:Serine aminopeptidase, S33 n=1 Tax=Pustulibacterium marinum TaxID=1224947 RepID=A0A1I7HXF8_9FLAO|nr:alpha/beta hydrolase [Pustulibacterium marinum]SFU65360.1 Serine aminopeptidase, S33 [Pustulibacterium marinum]
MSTNRFFMWMKRFLIGISFLLLMALAVVYWYVPRLVIEIKNPLLYHPRTYAHTYPSTFPDGEMVSLKSYDGVSLVGYLSYTSIEAKGTIILLHGIRGGKEDYISLCEQLHASGYHTFALDLRAHGASGDVFNTFGAKERYDVGTVVDFLKARQLPHIGVWGRSLGGAIALQALVIDKRLEYGIIESTFSDFNAVVHNYTELFTGIDSRYFSDFLVKRAGALATFDPKVVKPVVACEAITQPVYMSHGTADRRIPFTDGEANFNALSSVQKEFESIPNATHGNVWYIAGEAHYRKILDFLNQNTIN